MMSQILFPSRSGGPAERSRAGMARGPRRGIGRLRSTLWSPGRLLLPILLVAAGAGPALAQTVPVRAGEHEDFTRLVLRVPKSGAWALVPAPGGFELRGPAGATFDTDEVWGRIPRDRIATLDPRGEGRLGIGVACDCHGEVFWEPDVGFVVDVIDGPAPPGAVAPGPVPPTRPMGTSLPLMVEAPTAPLLPATWDDAATTPPREAVRVARTEAALLDSVAEAARHGFLDLAPGVDLGDAEAEAAEPPADDDAPALDARQPGLALRTAAEAIGPEREPLGATGTPCLPAEDFDLAGWAGHGDFGTEIPARIAAVTDARDLLDPAAAESLARAYLAFGFGREARVALDLDGRSSRGRDVLRHLARLLDGEPVPPTAFEGQAGCVGPVALWRALARGTLRGTDERERTAMTLALRDLPPGSRDAVALRLAGLFLDAGDAAGAQAVAARSDGTGGDVLLARAEIARGLEGPAAALAELEDAADHDPRMTPEAAAELLDLLVDEGRPVGEDLLALARALRFEHGGSRVLLVAEARALSAEGRFEEALALLDGERMEAPGADLDGALAATVETLTIELEEEPFLEIALGGLPDRLPTEAAEAVARRLSDLGFPDEAWALRTAGGGSGATDLGASMTEAEVPQRDASSPTQTAFQPSPSPSAAALSRLLPPSGVQANDIEGLAAPNRNEPTAPAGVAIPPPPPLAEPATGAGLPVGTPISAGPLAPGAITTGPELVRVAPGPQPATAQVPSDPLLVPLGEPSMPPPAAPTMSLADRRTLLVQAEDARARAAALLGQGLSD